MYHMGHMSLLSIKTSKATQNCNTKLPFIFKPFGIPQQSGGMSTTPGPSSTHVTPGVHEEETLQSITRSSFQRPQLPSMSHNSIYTQEMDSAITLDTRVDLYHGRYGPSFPLTGSSTRDSLSARHKDYHEFFIALRQALLTMLQDLQVTTLNRSIPLPPAYEALTHHDMQDQQSYEEDMRQWEIEMDMWYTRREHREEQRLVEMGLMKVELRGLGGFRGMGGMPQWIEEYWKGSKAVQDRLEETKAAMAAEDKHSRLDIQQSARSI